jgi:diguanylate cyclase (GGDEF)-like protein
MFGRYLIGCCAQGAGGVVCVLLMTVALHLSGAAAGLDRWLYDQSLRLWSRPAPDDLVIVAIDDRSLSSLGRWPWDREVHARLTRELMAAEVDSIAFDILFTESSADDDAADNLLADAIAEHGRVVLPMVASMTDVAGSVLELLPVPALTGAAAALAHVDVVPDPDGMVRGIWRNAGLGDPHWPVLADALLNVDNAIGYTPLRRSRTVIAVGEAGSPFQWHRTDRVLIPYAGPDGHYRRLSYVDVLEGRVPREQLAGRMVLVGATAMGLGDRFAIPTSVGSRYLSGVEIQANLVDAIRQSKFIRTMGDPGRLVLTLGLVALLLVGIPGRRGHHIRELSAGLVFTIMATLVLLHWGQLWFAPGTAIAGLVIGHLINFGRRYRQLRWVADRDGLTGIANRRRFEEALAQEWARSGRTERPLGLILIDVDHFKRYNDRYGHGAGDACLQSLSRTFASVARRPADIVARYGGEEFAILLPETDLSGTRAVAERLRAQVADLAIAHADSEMGVVSISLGVTSVVAQPNIPVTPGDFVGQADGALYQAKTAGRGRVCVAEPTAPSLPVS